MAKKTVYINYVDGIDVGRVKNLMGIISSIVAQEKPDILYFLFSSSGGEVDAGVALYNFLKALPVKIVMHNIGSIDSIANVIFMAGSRRYAVPHATFLFHGVQMHINNPTTLALPNLKEMLDRINKNHNTIAGIVCENSELEEEEVRKLFAEGETKDVDFASKKGIISKIKSAQIPKDALFVSVNING
jgi:ATP-dependent Clp protease protease subunit